MRITLALACLFSLTFACSGSTPSAQSRELVDAADEPIPRAVGSVDTVDPGVQSLHPEHVLLADFDPDWIELQRTPLTATGTPPPPIGCLELDGFSSMLGAQPETHAVWEQDDGDRLTQTVYLTSSVEDAESIVAVHAARMFADCDRLDELGLTQTSAVDLDLGVGFRVVEVADVDGFVGRGVVASRDNLVSFLSLQTDGSEKLDEAAFSQIINAMLERMDEAEPVPGETILIAPAV